MRSFVLAAHDVPVDEGFSLDALPSHGRMDLVARFLSASLLTSHGVRSTAEARLVLGNELVVRVDGGEVEGLNPDERSVAGVLRKAVEEAGYREHEVQTGVYVAPGDLGDAVDDAGGTVVWMQEDGEAAAEVEPPEDATMVFSDHLDFTEEDVEVLDQRADVQLSLAPTALHADHAAAAAQVWLDTGGYTDS